jgi:hypothetical protein
MLVFLTFAPPGTPTKPQIMALTFTSVQAPASAEPVQNKSTPVDSALLSMLVLSVYAAQGSRKAFRKLKRRFLWTAFKLKLKSFFAPKQAAADRQVVLYILIGILALVLIFYAPIAALIVALVGLILYLTGTI